VAELDDEYIAKMEDVLETYERAYDPAEPVVCLDEKPVVLHADVRPTSPAVPGREARQDSEYERRGTANIFCAVEPKAGRHFTFPTRDRSAFRFAVVACELALQYPQATTIHVVMDNLNIHRRKSLTDSFGTEVGTEIWNRFTVHYTAVGSIRPRSKSASLRGSAWVVAEFQTCQLCVGNAEHGADMSTANTSRSIGSSAAEQPVASSAIKGMPLSGQRTSRSAETPQALLAATSHLLRDFELALVLKYVVIPVARKLMCTLAWVEARGG
jgi:hypothetical protein